MSKKGPDGFSSALDCNPEKIEHKTIRSKMRHIGLDYDPSAGKGLKIGVADSVEQLGDRFNGDVVYQDDFRPPDCRAQERSRPPHGEMVADIIYNVLPEATFEFYRILPLSEPDTDKNDSESSVDSDSIVRGIKKAVERGVDILNISAGVDGRYSTAGAELAAAAKRAAQNGVIIVAASGNKSNVKRLCHPSSADASLSVGGCVERCTYKKTKHYLGDKRIWMRSLEETNEMQGPFCSKEGCSPSMNACDDHHSTKWWKGNVPPKGENPHTTAPCYHFVAGNKRHKSKLKTGTSFSAPLITGLVGRLLSANEDTDLAPQSVINIVQKESEVIEFDPQNNFYRRKANAQQILQSTTEEN